MHGLLIRCITASPMIAPHPTSVAAHCEIISAVIVLQDIERSCTILPALMVWQSIHGVWCMAAASQAAAQGIAFLKLECTLQGTTDGPTYINAPASTVSTFTSVAMFV